MTREYDRPSRVSLSGSGSSARLLREDELTPAERRSKDAQAADTGTHYIDMLCDRYRDRGVAGKVHADEARQRKQEALNRAVAPGSYVVTEKLTQSRRGTEAEGDAMDQYRSGRSGGRRFMTADDFDRYYHDQRRYRNPQYQAPVVQTVRYDPAELMAEASAEVLPPKKAGWLTDTDKLPAPLRKLMRLPFAQRLNEWAAETFPKETTVVASRKRARPMPVGAVAGLAVVAVSMALVIGSTVLVSQSTREVSELQAQLESEQARQAELSDELDLKNDLLSIRERAVNELGMVGEAYVNGSYVEDRGEDHLEIENGGDTEERKSGWSAILSAFGFGD